jgi:hypothetical protein
MLDDAHSWLVIVIYNGVLESLLRSLNTVDVVDVPSRQRVYSHRPSWYRHLITLFCPPYLFSKSRAPVGVSRIAVVKLWSSFTFGTAVPPSSHH